MGLLLSQGGSYPPHGFINGQLLFLSGPTVGFYSDSTKSIQKHLNPQKLKMYEEVLKSNQYSLLNTIIVVIEF